MAVEFRCNTCGKLLKGEGGGTIRCPHCRGKTVVPTALASLPSPKVAPDAPAEATGSRGEAGPAPEPAAMAALAGAMPWVLSMMLHLGLFLIMVFVVMISTRPAARVQAVEVFRSPVPATLGGMTDPKTEPFNKARDSRREVRHPRTRRDEKPRREAMTDTPVPLLAPGPGDDLESGRAELGLTDKDIRGGPRFYDKIGPRGVRNIVYVVDRSGSMAAEFEDVKLEMLRSIRGLRALHRFHVILFSEGRTIEGPRRYLVPGDPPNRVAAGEFLKKQQAGGRTTALVALKRAFAVLQGADPDKPGKLIYLLSDGDFAGITGGSTYRPAGGGVLRGNEAIIQWLRDHNRDKSVLINTLLLHRNDPTAKKVLRAIAEENGGGFKYISPEE